MHAQASRIEFLIRYQQSKNLFVGANLLELRDSMNAAAIRAIEGDWQKIGAELGEAVAAVTARHWKTTARRILAIGLPLAVAVVTIKFFPHWPTAYHNLVLFSCVGYVVVQVLSLLDPDFAERLALAGKITASVIKRN